MLKILTYNNISPVGLDRLPRDKYEVASEIQRPDAIMLRSFKLHGIAIPDSVKCVGRAGAGVNNIPVADYSQRGIIPSHRLCKHRRYKLSELGAVMERNRIETFDNQASALKDLLR